MKTGLEATFNLYNVSKCHSLRRTSSSNRSLLCSPARSELDNPCALAGTGSQYSVPANVGSVFTKL